MDFAAEVAKGVVILAAWEWLQFVKPKVALWYRRRFAKPRPVRDLSTWGK